MMIGERDALDFGVEVSRVRLFVFGAGALLVGASVAASGSVGYVGLIVPHLVRMATGSDNRSVIPFSALAGAIVRRVGGYGRTRGDRSAGAASRCDNCARRGSVCSYIC